MFWGCYTDTEIRTQYLLLSHYSLGPTRIGSMRALRVRFVVIFTLFLIDICLFVVVVYFVILFCFLYAAAHVYA